MIAPEVYAARRTSLQNAVAGPILLVGNGHRPRNLPAYGVPFRQDSTFLYFTGCASPDAALLLADGEEILFLPPVADDDALWHGTVETIEQTGRQLGFSRVEAIGALAAVCAPHQGRLKTLAVPDQTATRTAARLSGRPTLRFGEDNGADDIVDAIIQMRRRLSAEEIQEMKGAVPATAAAHRAAMAATRPGSHERQIAAIFTGVIAAHGLTTAYDSIVTVRGEVLHNHHHIHPLAAGQLLLLDGGAEARTGYANDVTRTWPVSGTFSPRQKAVYEAVLAAQQEAIAMVRPGVRYRDVHTKASRVLATFLSDEGLLTVSPDAALESGAHALFFPHGIGHLLGLDVHDLEAFGDRAQYAPGRTRSTQFGTAYLRLDLDLEPGMVVTIEPGIYFVPAILADTTLTARFRGQVDLDRARSWLGFGGVRVEDNVVVTDSDPDVITAEIPKTVADVEAAIATPFDWMTFTGA